MLRPRERDSIEEESRLFGGGKQRDSGSVKIIPGQTFRQKPGTSASFKPYNTISNGAKSSGPVRASGKKKYFSSQPRSNGFADSPERSSKRRRVESPEEAPRRIEISDDEIIDRSSSGGSPVAARGSKSEQQTVDKGAKELKSKAKKRATHSTWLSSEDRDLSFTRDAVKERRRESGGFEQVARKLPEQTSNLSVEIIKKPLISGDNAATTTPPPRYNGNSRPSFPRESPDELQGDVTVGPVPTSLGKNSKGQPASTSSDIRPTVFISNDKSKRGIGKGKKEKPKKGLPPSQTFKIFYFRKSPFLKEALGGDNDKLKVDPGNGELTVTVADSAIVHTISLQKVLKVLVGGRSSRKVRFELSKVERDDTKLDLELSSSEEKENLRSLLRTLKVEVQERDEIYIDNAFQKSVREHQRFQATTNGYKRPLRIEITEETPTKPSPGPAKRMKLSEALQDNGGNAAAEPGTSIATRGRSSPSATAPGEDPNPRRAPSPHTAPQRSIGLEIPVTKFYSGSLAPVRATRSTARQEPTTLVCDDDDDDEDGHKQDDTSHPSLGGVDQKWNKPLVYPRFGKKKAEVSATDLDRLAPHEFLNDNIIGFYIRFLEDHLQRCDAEVAKRVYFFNSYFFDTLTNSRRRTINYEGVEKWTRSVDLFSYNYIVVPINEAAHWYLAVICNLPHLEGIMEEGKNPAFGPRGEVSEVPETPEPPQQGAAAAYSRANKEEATRQSLASMNLLGGQNSQGDSKSGDDEWPDLEENPDSTRAKLSDYSSQPQPDPQKEPGSTGTPKKTRKAKRKSTLGMRYDICQPIVITFDSLNQGRSSTISTLREYLFAEAKSKRGIEINKSLIKGMTAKEIPEQPNFSDCGLYLLAYVEKFVQDPDIFVRKLLRKEMRSKEDWPPLRSGLLRSRLRKFMELLYSEQEQLTKDKAGDKTLMVDQRPISYLLGTPVTDEVEEMNKDEEKPQVQVQVERSPPADAKSRSPSRSRDPSKSPQPYKSDAKHVQNTTNAKTQESVVYIDQKPVPRGELPEPEARHERSKGVYVEVLDSQENASAPTVNVAQMTEPRSPPAPPAGHPSAFYIDESDGVEEWPPQKKEMEASRRKIVQVQVNETPPPRSPNAR
ncbi:uncharacterized protein BDV17DRAFT_53478 [Aspergillus undulatus]|uniref:uncharacterized protein n=1 Tax=Aspergillus undulatus TaxID=1810928 RepID=UPI003CCCF52F